MAVCTYDNPATMRRECWQDGHIVCWYDSKLYALEKWNIPANSYFFGANVGDWKAGQIVGDPGAMKIAHRGLR